MTSFCLLLPTRSPDISGNAPTRGGDTFLHKTCLSFSPGWWNAQQSCLCWRQRLGVVGQEGEELGFVCRSGVVGQMAEEVLELG